MAETFTLSELIIPGTYVRVNAEALIGAAGISTGNIGIVGTASQGRDDTQILSDYSGAKSIVGSYDAFKDGQGKLNLTRGLELLYMNGARTVYARALDPAKAAQNDYIAAFNELIKDDVNILVAPELATDTAKAVFGSVLETAENNGRDVMAVIGSDASTVANIKAQVTANDRMIFVAPGIRTFDSAAGSEVTLKGTYTAAAVAGLMSTLAPQSSPTNKIIPGVVKLDQRFSYGEISDLIKAGVLVLEERQGVRVVRGITTEMASNGPFRQITTRRITDFAKAGIRQASDGFIGRLNNQRVRKALQTAIAGFLTSMVQDEALTGFTVDVTATRDDEIAGRAIVNAVIQPTFSIDFIAVTMFLQ